MRRRVDVTEAEHAVAHHVVDVGSDAPRPCGLNHPRPHHQPAAGEAILNAARVRESTPPPAAAAVSVTVTSLNPGCGSISGVLDAHRESTPVTAPIGSSAAASPPAPSSGRGSRHAPEPVAPAGTRSRSPGTWAVDAAVPRMRGPFPRSNMASITSGVFAVSASARRDSASLAASVGD